MRRWREFRLWYAGTLDPNALFAFKRTCLISLLEKFSIDNFLLLDEPKFLLLRVEVEDALAKQISSLLRGCITSKTLFSKLTVAEWSPTADARKRILDARQRAKVPTRIPRGGWMIKGKAQDGTWIAAPENLDKQVTAFSSFMCRVTGNFTKAYLKEMPYRVEDRWLMSLFLHLILNSVSVWQTEENEIREFPYV